MSEQKPPNAASIREAPQTSPRGARCCSLGCGGCLILLALLTLGAWFGYTRFGSPWLEAKAGGLIERIPPLGTLLNLKDSLPLKGVTLGGGLSGSEDPGDFPTDVWLPADTIDSLVNVGEGSALAAVEVADVEGSQLSGKIRSEMQALGWEWIPVRDPQGGSALLFQKEDRSASYLVYPRGDTLRVVVKVGTAPSFAARP